jgi:hypothetical protein
MRVWYGVSFDYSGGRIQHLPNQFTDKALHDKTDLENEWRDSFSAGSFDFRIFIGIQPKIVSPDNFLQMLVTDSFASTLLVRWTLTADDFDWRLGVAAPLTPLSLVATGFFGTGQVFLRLSPVYYHEEP